MNLLLEFFLPGALLGLMASLSPGPLMALLLSESLRGGFKRGAKVAVAPLVTDVPFIIAAIAIAKGIESSPTLLGLVSLTGAAVLTFFAFQNLKVRKEAFEQTADGGSALLKGIVINLTNPYMYLYWFSVSTPVFARGNTEGSILFAAGILGCSVLAMLFYAAAVSRARMKIFAYAHWVLKILSVALLYFAFTLLQSGLGFMAETQWCALCYNLLL